MMTGWTGILWVALGILTNGQALDRASEIAGRPTTEVDYSDIVLGGDTIRISRHDLEEIKRGLALRLKQLDSGMADSTALLTELEDAACLLDLHSAHIGAWRLEEAAMDASLVLRRTMLNENIRLIYVAPVRHLPGKVRWSVEPIRIQVVQRRGEP